MELLRKLNLSGKTIIMVTHEVDIAGWARRVVRMRDGHVESDERNEELVLTTSAPGKAVPVAAVVPPDTPDIQLRPAGSPPPCG
jgi:energy-coupling factor transporter ATP-binding protein EcfA2